MSNTSDLTDGIVAIFNALNSEVNNEKRQLLESIGDNEIIQQATKALQDNNIQRFNYVCRKITSPIDAMILSIYAIHSAEYKFAVKNYRMIERNFCNLFKVIEGAGCSADKSKTVMRNLIIFLRTDEGIKFDYDGEYTFHLPKKIFKTHEQIYDFFVALMRFDMGYPNEFIKIYGTIIGGVYE